MSFSLLERLIELETAVSPLTFAPEGERPYTHQPGQLPILISAPHATVHTRCRRLKKEEGFTGALAHLLAETTGAHAFYSRYRSADDPNWDEDSPYKQGLQEIIRTHDIQFVLDLHGMSDQHKIGVALGSMNGRSCPNQEPLILQTVAEQLTQTDEDEASAFSQLRWDHFVLNHSRFTGGVANHTITRFVSQKLGVSALQIELCSSVRVVKKRPSTPLTMSSSQPAQPINQTIALMQTLVDVLAHAM